MLDPRLVIKHAIASTHKTLKRGVKEVQKALRKSTKGKPDLSNPVGIVIIAADISPMDVISHMPILCEDHNVPYVYVRSRAQLGMAGATKRATSVVMLTKEPAKKDGTESAEWTATYGSMLKLAQKMAKTVLL